MLNPMGAFATRIGVGRASVALATFMLVGCSLRSEVPRAISQPLAAETQSFEVDVLRCDSSPKVEVTETAEEVRVRIVATTESSCGNDCADIVTVQLDNPLGDRRLIDESTGQKVDRL